MKAEELKIGDIINFGGEKAKVVALSSECKDAITVQCLEDGGESRIWEASLLDEIDSIPLTSEILEKNGWKAGNEIWGIDYIKDRLHIAFFSKSKDMVAMVSSIDDSDMCVCLRQIKFVHELQHILRALGMDDDLKI